MCSSASSPASPLMVCCPVCGSRRISWPGTLSEIGCPDWWCPDCGAYGVLSTGHGFDEWRGLDDDAELVVYDYPGWRGVGVPLRRPLFDCCVPFVMPSDDANMVWSDSSHRWCSGWRCRTVYAPSGVEVGSLYLDHGVWCVVSLKGMTGRGMLFETADDLREWLADGACGVLPRGSFVSFA